MPASHLEKNSSLIGRSFRSVIQVSYVLLLTMLLVVGCRNDDSTKRRPVIDQTLSIESVKNADYKNFYPGLAEGKEVMLGGVKFDLPSSRPKWMSKVNGSTSLPTLKLPCTVERAKSVNLLLNTGNSFTSKMKVGDNVGNITLNYESGPPDVIVLQIGKNIREWRTGSKEQIIVSTENKNTREVYHEYDNAPGKVVDMISIPLTGERVLKEVVLNDESQKLLRGPDPVLNLLAVTVQSVSKKENHTFLVAIVVTVVGALVIFAVAIFKSKPMKPPSIQKTAKHVQCPRCNWKISEDDAVCPNPECKTRF